MFGRRLPGSQQWVSKTDLSRLYRCSFAFWLLDTGQIAFPETVSAFQMSLIRAGQDYQDLVEQSATPVTISPADLPALLQTELTILGTPLFGEQEAEAAWLPGRHRRCERRAIPRSRSSLTGPPPHLVRLELAFYWLLLQPYRTRQAPAAGVLILRRDGRPMRVEVPVTRPPARFAPASAGPPPPPPALPPSLPWPVRAGRSRSAANSL